MSTNALPRTSPLPARRRARAASVHLRRHVRVLSILVAAMSGLVMAACRQEAPVVPPAQVTVAPAVGREVNDWDEFTGYFEPVDAVEVRPRVSGYVQRVAFAEGATVRRGDPLFIIDPRPYEAEVARAEAELAQARTRAQLADMELERARRLVATQAISREELDARQSGRAEGDAAVRAAAAELATARLDLEWTVVRAPISGRVGRAEVTPGNLVQAGSPEADRLTTIVSLDPIYVYFFDTDEQAYLKFVRSMHRTPGDRIVRVGLANETDFPHQGTLDFVDNRLDHEAGTIRVRAVLANPAQLFAPGMFARVRLEGRAPYPATLVEDRAIGTDQDRKFVFVLKPDSSVDYRAVTVGRLVDGLRVVTTGLRPGEDIVVNGLVRVRPGMKVAATRAAMSPDSTRVASAAP